MGALLSGMMGSGAAASAGAGAAAGAGASTMGAGAATAGAGAGGGLVQGLAKGAAFAQKMQQPGGVLREVGTRFGDNPLGKMAGTIGEAFDPIGGNFDIAALLDEKRLKQNQMLRKEIGGMQEKGDEHWVIALAQRLKEMGKQDG